MTTHGQLRAQKTRNVVDVPVLILIKVMHRCALHLQTLCLICLHSYTLAGDKFAHELQGFKDLKPVHILMQSSTPLASMKMPRNMGTILRTS